MLRVGQLRIYLRNIIVVIVDMTLDPLLLISKRK